jgi:hypothetical protein
MDRPQTATPSRDPERTEPTPTPRPATYNSPTTPVGTGRNQPSSTNNADPGNGEPIGGAPNPAVSGALKATHIVVSDYIVAPNLCLRFGLTFISLTALGIR